MRKKLFIIGGNLCVGKTTTCRKLMRELPNSVFFDVDSCFEMNPRIWNKKEKEERLEMISNLCCGILNHYIHTSIIDNIVFCYGRAKQTHFDWFLSQLDLDNVDLYNITLIVNEKVYLKRFRRAIKRGERPKFWVGIKDGQQVREKAETHYLSRLHKFEQLDSIKIDTSNLIVDEVVRKIIQISEQK